MTGHDSLRRTLLTLHRELLEEQRKAVERSDGRMAPAELLQALTDDPQFLWLRSLSELIAMLDHARAKDDEALYATTLDRLRKLLLAPDEKTLFGGRYLQALQEHPAVVFIHRDAVALLAERKDPAE